MKIVLLSSIVIVLACAVAGFQPPTLGDPEQVVSITEAPYHVSIHRDGNYICSGVIISSTNILTTGSCADSHGSLYPNYKYKVYAGTTKKYNEDGYKNVSRMYAHTKYSSSKKFDDYDIGIIELSDPLKFSDSIQPIELPSRIEHVNENEFAYITGFGRPNSEASLPYDLFKVLVLTVNQETCKQSYGNSVITNRFLCAGLLNIEHKGNCVGNTGSPLIAVEKLHGIALGGCGDEDTPNLFVRVSAHREWIRSQVHF